MQTSELNQQTLTVCLNTNNPDAACPLCGQFSSKIQSTYQRQLADLNWANFSVQLRLSVRRFYCLNPACTRKIFCERLAQLTRPYARRTNRLRQFLQTLALALGGRPAARLAEKQSLKTSRPSLLRLLEQLELPKHLTPRVLGVDEFALKRGQTYAALLVDLETHQPIEVLPDRSSETFGNWLKAHSGIEIISRDRASGFAKAARLEAPLAQQVADRFHVLKNLTDHLDHFFKRKKIWKQPLLAYRKLLAKPAKEFKASTDGATLPAGVSKPNRVGREEQLKIDRYAHRLDRYQQVVALKEKGLSNRQVGQELGLGRNTVNRYVRAGSAEVVESKAKTLRSSVLNPYKSYLWRRWLEDQPTIKQLHQELIQQGYAGSTGPIRAFLVKLRPSPWWSATRTKPRRKLEPKDLPQLAYERKISARSAVWLIFKRDADDETLSEEQRYQLKQLVESDPQIHQVYELVQQFRQLVREKQGDKLKSWLERVKATEIKELVSFAGGIERDQAAVEAGINLEWSNAQLEGQVNRAKTIKKQMYGRASFKLLRTRILAA